SAPTIQWSQLAAPRCVKASAQGAAKTHAPNTRLIPSFHASIRDSAHSATRNTRTAITQAFHAARPAIAPDPAGAVAPASGARPLPNCSNQGEINNQAANTRLAQSCGRFRRL